MSIAGLKKECFVFAGGDDLAGEIARKLGQEDRMRKLL